MSAEEWRPVAWAPRYEVSNLGRVRSHCRPGHPIMLRPYPNRQGYLRVALMVGGGRGRTVFVHRLVGPAFLGEMPAGLQTRHLDGNPANNRVDNLKYGTGSENTADRLRHADPEWVLRPSPERNRVSKAARVAAAQARDAIRFGVAS